MNTDSTVRPVPIVDTHQHLWDVSKVRPPWLQSAGKLNRSFVMDDYRQATAGLKRMPIWSCFWMSSSH